MPTRVFRLLSAGVQIIGFLAVSNLPAAAANDFGPSLYKQPVEGLTRRSACASARHYQRLVSAINKRAMAHLGEIVRNRKYPIDMSLPKRERVRLTKRQFKRIEADREEMERIHRRSRFGYPLNVKCQPLPHTTLIVEETWRYDKKTLCVRAKGWSACQWTHMTALSRYRPSRDRKTWRP